MLITRSYQFYFSQVPVRRNVNSTSASPLPIINILGKKSQICLKDVKILQNTCQNFSGFLENTSNLCIISIFIPYNQEIQ